MRFKEWFAGLVDYPGAASTNSNLPVRSKYTANDGPVGTDSADGAEPDKAFGFTSPEAKKASRERQSKWIDRKRKRVPMERIPPDTIY